MSATPPENRLVAGVEASAIVRNVSASGGFAAILKRGDPERGSLLLVVACRGEHFSILQRELDVSVQTYCWRRIGPPAEASSEQIRNFLDNQARFDLDCWQTELDIPDPERFIAETIALG